MNIYQKIVAVRKSVGGIKKDKQADRYSYVSGSQVLEKIQDEMNNQNLLLYPEIVPDTAKYDRYTYTMTYKNGGTKEVVDYVVSAQCVMVWIDGDSGETLRVPFTIYGEQENDVAKAYGSALTYAERYFLLKFFNLPTDELDPDAKKTRNEEPKVEVDPEIEKIKKRFVNEVEIISLQEILKAKGVPVSEIYRVYNIEKLEDLNFGQFKDSMTMLDKMPDRKAR